VDLDPDADNCQHQPFLTYTQIHLW